MFLSLPLCSEELALVCSAGSLLTQGRRQPRPLTPPVASVGGAFITFCRSSCSYAGDVEINVEIKKYFCKAGVKGVQV